MTKKLNNKKGFTLAELLVVVAIIAVLVAVSIPIFSAQTKKANFATNQANARAAKAAAVTMVLGNGATGDQTIKYTIADGSYTVVDSTKIPTDGVKAADPNLDPATWAVGTPANIEAGVYQSIYVTINKDGKVTSYTLAEKKA